MLLQLDSACPIEFYLLTFQIIAAHVEIQTFRISYVIVGSDVYQVLNFKVLGGSHYFKREIVLVTKLSQVEILSFCKECTRKK